MAKEEIIVRINEDTLQIEAEVEGMVGSGCRSFMDAFQRAMKMTAKSERLKPEYRKGKTKVRSRQ